MRAVVVKKHVNGFFVSNTCSFSHVSQEGTKVDSVRALANIESRAVLQTKAHRSVNGGARESISWQRDARLVIALRAKCFRAEVPRARAHLVRIHEGLLVQHEFTQEVAEFELCRLPFIGHFESILVLRHAVLDVMLPVVIPQRGMVDAQTLITVQLVTALLEI